MNSPTTFTRWLIHKWPLHITLTHATTMMLGSVLIWSGCKTFPTDKDPTAEESSAKLKVVYDSKFAMVVMRHPSQPTQHYFATCLYRQTSMNNYEIIPTSCVNAFRLNSGALPMFQLATLKELVPSETWKEADLATLKRLENSEFIKLNQYQTEVKRRWSQTSMKMTQWGFFSFITPTIIQSTVPMLSPKINALLRTLKAIGVSSMFGGGTIYVLSSFRDPPTTLPNEDETQAAVDEIAAQYEYVPVIINQWSELFQTKTWHQSFHITSLSRAVAQYLNVYIYPDQPEHISEVCTPIQGTLSSTSMDQLLHLDADHLATRSPRNYLQTNPSQCVPVTSSANAK